VLLGLALAGIVSATFAASSSRFSADPRARARSIERVEQVDAARGVGETEEEERATFAPEILRERYEQRSSGGPIPFDGLIRAKEQIDLMRVGQRDAGIWSNWEPLGPGNIGGRIRAILVHPTTTTRMWVGGVSGGIWRSDNSGVSWFPLNDFLPTLAVTSLVLDPTNPNVMYAATGEGSARTPNPNTTVVPGAGIFRTTNGGATWTQLASTSNSEFSYVNRLERHPTTANTLYAVTEDGGSTFAVRRTTDGGANWTTLLTPGAPPADIDLQPGNPNRILVGCRSGNGAFGEVWLSTDGGVEWDEQTTDLIPGSGKLPDSTARCETAWGTGNYIYVSMNRGLDANGNGGEIWRTTDLGASWGKRSSIGLNYLSAGDYANALWVDPTWNEYVVCGGLDLYRSTNGGTSFTRISAWAEYHNGGSATSAHADHHEILHHPGYNGGSNRIVFFGNDGGIQKVDDIDLVTQTTGWTNLANGLAITQFYGGAAAADGSVIVGGAQDNDKLRYRPADGVNGWFQLQTGDGGYCAVDPTDPDNLVAGGTSIWRTTNGGSNWSQIRAPISGSPKCSAISIKPGNSNEIWVGYTDGVISCTTNAGSNWTNVHTGVPDRWIMDIEASPHFLNEAIVVLGGYNADNVWITGNGGTSWAQRTGTAPDALPALQVNTTSYHPTDVDWIYIGSDLGIFASEDFGVTWNATPAYDNNDGPANVEVDDLFWYEDMLVAATYGRGMFQTRPLPTVYVDLGNAGTEDGTLAHPYDTVGEGIDASGNGTTLSIRTATYLEGATVFDRAGVVVATDGTVVVR